MPESPKAKFRFYAQPFLLLTICLCVGILLGYDLKDYFKVFLSACLVVIAFICFFFYRTRTDNHAFIFFTAIGFILCGAILIQARNGAVSNIQLSKIYQEGDLLLVKLRDAGNSDKEWKKMTGDIRRIYKDHHEISINEPLVLFVQKNNFGCESGDIILVSTKLNKIENPGNPGEFDAKNYWNKKGFQFMTFVGEDQYRIISHAEPNRILNKLNSIREYLKKSLEDNLEGQELAIALALILGDKSLLDVETTTSFTNTGAMHVLAVSGLHIGIIMQILMALFGNFPKLISKRNAVILVVVIMWIYAIITGLSPSVLRAVFMFTVLAIAQLRGKNYNSINSLFFTAFVLMLVDPFTLFDIGFQLSFLAMLGIFLLYKPIEQLVYIENKWLRKVWQGTAIGFGAQLLTTPLSLYYFHQFPNYFVLTNIGLMASSGLILGTGIFLFCFNWLKPIAKLTGFVLSVIIWISLSFIEWVEGLPGAVAYGYEVPILLVLILSLLVLHLFLFTKSRLNKLISYSLGFIILIFIVIKRFENLTVNEICIFNSRQTIITIRKGGNLFCFYKADPEDFKKVKFAVEGYLKMHPATIHYCPLNEKNWNLNYSDTKIYTRKEKGSVLLTVNNQKYTIIQSDYSSKIDENSISIGMPWIEFPVDHSLNDGAFIRPI